MQKVGSVFFQAGDTRFGIFRWFNRKACPLFEADQAFSPEEVHEFKNSTSGTSENTPGRSRRFLNKLRKINLPPCKHFISLADSTVKMIL